MPNSKGHIAHALGILFIALMVFSACQSRVICPAYADTFILDDSVRDYRFSLFMSDTAPKPAPAYEKAWNGLATFPGFNKRFREMRIISMEKLYAPLIVVDTLRTPANIAQGDSTALVDSVDYFTTQAPPDALVSYNMDQYIYMALIGDELAKRRERVVKMQEARMAVQKAKADSVAAAKAAKKANKKGFLGGLFGGKKKKAAADSTATNTPAPVDPDPADTTANN